MPLNNNQLRYNFHTSRGDAKTVNDWLKTREARELSLVDDCAMQASLAIGSTPYLHCYSGKYFSILHPHPSQIDIRDIAHALSYQPRYNAHTKWGYSVAHHSLLCSFYVDKGYELDALLHDKTEAYMPDLPRGYKHHTEFGKGFIEYENKIDEIISKKLQVAYPMPPQVKYIDNRILSNEFRDCLHKVDLSRLENYDPIPGLKIEKISPISIKRAFLYRYYELVTAREETDGKL